MPKIRAEPSTTTSSGAPATAWPAPRASSPSPTPPAATSKTSSTSRPSRITQIYNAIDPQFLTPQVSDREQHRALERYGITYPYLLYAGNIRPQKNIPRLIEAFAVVRDELSTHPVYKELRLVIIGDEISKHAAVRRAVIQTRTQASVRFLGFVPFETLRAFYQHAEVFTFPSLYEGFGLPPLEAMACGTPVVTSSVSSLPEAVGNAAVMVSPENVFSISRGIKEALLDVDLRQDLRQPRLRAGHEVPLGTDGGGDNGRLSRSGEAGTGVNAGGSGGRLACATRSSTFMPITTAAAIGKIPAEPPFPLEHQMQMRLGDPSPSRERGDGGMAGVDAPGDLTDELLVECLEGHVYCSGKYSYLFPEMGQV